MREVDETKPKAASALNLAGIIELLREVIEKYAELDPGASLETEIAAARRVSLNDDGSVNISLSVPVKAAGDSHTDIRLRPLRARDYFDNTTTNIVESADFADTLEMASKLLTRNQTGAVDAIENMEDAKAVFFGVVVVRKNFYRPKE